MTNINMLEVIAVLVLLDTTLGFLGALKTHTVKSSIGRLGFTQKLAEILLILAISFLVNLDPQHFPQPLLTGLYAGLALFEITSVVENMSSLGLNIGWIMKYFSGFPEPSKDEKDKQVETPDPQDQKINIKK